MSEPWQEILERDGVARIPSVFSKDEMDLLRCFSWKAFRRANEDQIQWKHRCYPALLFGPSGLQGWRLDSRMVRIVQAALGDNVLQLNNQVYFRLPGDGDQFSWHQDISFRIPQENFNQIETGYLQTAIIIDDMAEDNGAIEYVLGSHKQGDLDLVPRDGSEAGLRRFDRSKFQGVKMGAKSGDVLVWSVMVVHGSEQNNSGRPRSYYMNGFAKAECVAGLDFPWYLKDGKKVV
jgi:hypothetical protein